MEKITKDLFCILIILLSLPSFSQQKLLSGFRAEASSGLLVSTNNRTPFLLKANRYGTVPLESQMLYLNTKLKKDYDSLYTIDRKLKRFNVGYELEPHINLGKTSQILLVQAYFKARYGAFEFYGGRRREIQGLVDTLGTMGSYIWSGNALPLPKVEVSIPNYTPILRNGLLSIKGNFAHGWFGKGDSVQNVWLHQKSFYARIGKPSWKLNLIGGFNHQVQWGGYPTKPFYDEISHQVINSFSTDFPTFLKVASGISMNKDGQGLTNPNGVPGNDATNRSGNHLGTIDIGIEISLLSFGKIMIYRQSIYEDGSLFYLNNISDGLLGFSFKPKHKILKNLSFEYIDSRSQGGELFEMIPELRGRDNYFNNSLYKDSWVYKNHIISNPLFFTDIENRQTKNKNYVINNRIQAVNFTIHYEMFKIAFVSKIVSSNNFGTYDTPRNSNRTSILNSAEFYFSVRKSLRITINNDIENKTFKNHGFDLKYPHRVK
jgi:hypothetical protein